jgi:hypothetical protein
MGPSEQIVINWAAIGICVTLIGWIVVHKLSRQREKEQRQYQLRRAISDFEVTINKWGKSINDTHVPRNRVWGFTLNGGIDFYADAINRVRKESIANIENCVLSIRPFMGVDSKSRLDKAWQDYQEYGIEGRDEKDPTTGQEFTSHVECKKGLIDCLEQMKKLASQIEL